MRTSIAKQRTVLSLRRKAETISFLNQLMSGTSYSLEDPEAPPWFQVGHIHEISRSIYMYHAEPIYLKWSDGPKFMFAVDRQPFQFFWTTEGRFYGRQLTEGQTFRFCQLAEVKRYT